MATASALTHSSPSSSLGRRVLGGVAGGLAGGIVFGMMMAMMAMMGMLPTIASMVGSSSAVVGFGVHLMISVLIGLGLTVLFGNRLLTGYRRGALVGVVHGAIWWVLGPLMIMPAMMGMPLFALNPTAVLSLMGHMVFGAILGLVAVRVIAGRP
ncbi:hypothetical protein [Arthrobacter sp. H35-D1]|uniref:hypothetical protein n=1 Tax=Arthrobacter sp. H35-D1 TaxID=3046202 RepID=UPI0024B8DFEF|nr:hypothetical protein [Arthrobacter sp. H35-D1]MDJ0314155.1 hypothetical protein [Arthrobacter sp. H35-D1]